jgi:hypothetical protein
MASSSKWVGAAVLLLLLLAAERSSVTHNVRLIPSPVPPRNPPRAPRRNNPFPPQPEPDDSDLEVPPKDARYPLYADLLWIQYAERAKRMGPLPSPTDLAAPRAGVARNLTDFERWALGRFVPAGFASVLLEQVTSDSLAPRFHRWSLAKLAFDLARMKGAPESMASELRRRVGRGLYEQARDHYRNNPA